MIKKRSVSPTVRLILGIIFVVISVMAIFQSLAVSAAFSLTEDRDGVDSGSYGVVAAILMLIIGIIFLTTRKNNSRAIKISTWVMGVIAIFLAIVASDKFGDMGIYAIFILVGVIWGNLTFKIKNKKLTELSPTEKVKLSTEEIVKFKKLLDDGAITQEEFDAKKKKLLNLYGVVSMQKKKMFMITIWIMQNYTIGDTRH